ncbi:hypothetical protein M0802_012019 [Mischocyttarus mexicanus]|nr:hypothetical protein M0802_012019 [Mischocyttarus mexicanus]
MLVNERIVSMVIDSVENHESEVESDENDDESTESVPTSGKSSQPTTTFTAKDNTVWSQTPPIQHQTPSRNIFRQRSGPHRSTETLSISETFKRVFNVEMVDRIVLRILGNSDNVSCK